MWPWPTRMVIRGKLTRWSWLDRRQEAAGHPMLNYHIFPLLRYLWALMILPALHGIEQIFFLSGCWAAGIEGRKFSFVDYLQSSGLFLNPGYLEPSPASCCWLLIPSFAPCFLYSGTHWLASRLWRTCGILDFPKHQVLIGQMLLKDSFGHLHCISMFSHSRLTETSFGSVAHCLVSLTPGFCLTGCEQLPLLLQTLATSFFCGLEQLPPEIWIL